MSSLPTVKYLPYTSLITAAKAIIQNKEFVLSNIKRNPS